MRLFVLPLRFFLMLMLFVTFAPPAQAVEREEIEQFLEVTGFDAALESIQSSAGQAPAMLGIEANEFGADWSRLADSVFDPVEMHDIAMEFLTALLDQDMLDHAVDFYGSELGQRLVEVENAAHLNDASEQEETEKARLLQDLRENSDSTRLDLFERMQDAIDSTGTGVRAIQEIQVRFLLTASAAGVIALRVDEAGLRAMMEEQAEGLREVLRENGLAASAYTYRTFSDADLEAYVEALEHPTMQKVYELLNAVQYQITANRFEVLAVRMADLHPVEDI